MTADAIQGKELPATASDAELITEAQRAEANERQETFWQAVKDHPKAIIWAVLINLTVIMEGYDTSLLGSFFAYPSFMTKYGDYHANIQGSISEKYQVSAAWQSGLTMASGASAFFGALANGYLVDRFGKKRVLLGSLLSLVGFIFIVFFAPDVKILLLGEILCGLPWGVFATLSPAYASEVMPLSLRVYLTSYTNLCFAFGGLLASGVLAGMVNISGPWSYHGPFAIQWFWPSFLIPLLLFIPESPWDLIRQQRLEDAKKSLQRLYSGDPELLDSILSLMIYTNNQEQELFSTESSYLHCFKGIDLRRTEIACLSFIGQITFGTYIGGSASYFFEQIGLSTSEIYNLNLGATALGVLGLILFWLFALPNFGRRTIYIAGGVLLMIDLLLIGILQVYSHIKGVSLAQAALVMIFDFLFNGSIAPLGWAIPAEVGSTRVRQKTVVLARNAYYVIQVTTGVLNTYMLNPTAWNLRGYVGFVWAGTSFISLFWVYFRFPETKGRMPEELNLLFSKKIPARKFSKYEVDVFGTMENDKAGDGVEHVEC